MTECILAAVLVLLATFVLGLLRVLRGPSRADCMLGAQLLGSAGVAVLLLLARALGRESLLDVALLLAFLAAITSSAFVALGRHSLPKEDSHDPAP
ncbi:monovalent cation/H+ antiporter complex subunit F [Thiovibrio sp. JS02]